MATFTASSFLYFTQNLTGESLRNAPAGLKFDFDPSGIGLKDRLPNRALKGGLFFLGSEALPQHAFEFAFQCPDLIETLRENEKYLEHSAK